MKYIVTEFMAQGNLLDLIKRKDIIITLDHMITMAKQTASGKSAKSHSII